MEINPENENSINDFVQKIVQNPQFGEFIEQQLRLAQQQQTTSSILNLTTNIQNIANNMNFVEQLQQNCSTSQKIDENFLLNENSKNLSRLPSINNKTDKILQQKHNQSKFIYFNKIEFFLDEQKSHQQHIIYSTAAPSASTTTNTTTNKQSTSSNFNLDLIKRKTGIF